MKTLLLAILIASAASVIGDSPVRIVDTLADLEQLYPNIEQPAAIVRGRLVRDDYSPPRVYFWNPDSSTTTNDSVRPVRFGLGRWVYSTNLVVDGRATVGHTNQFAATVTIKGFAFGTSGLVMERFGVGTNGISIAGGQVSFRREDPSNSRFIAAVVDTDTTASLYLGGNSYSGFSSGRLGGIYAPGVDLATTNENKVGGDLFLSAGPGSGAGTPSRISFSVPATNSASATTGQGVYTMLQIRHPAVVDVTNNNTALKVTYVKEVAGTNYYVTARMVITNESGVLRPIFIEE